MGSSNSMISTRIQNIYLYSSPCVYFHMVARRLLWLHVSHGIAVKQEGKCGARHILFFPLKQKFRFVLFFSSVSTLTDVLLFFTKLGSHSYC